MKTRQLIVALLSLVLTFTTLIGAKAAVTANAGYAYSWSANGLTNTINWNNGSFSNFAIVDGGISAPYAYTADIYDNGLMVDVCATSGCAYNASMTNYTGPGSMVGTAATTTLYQGSVQTINGLNVTSSYKFSKTTAVARLLIQLDNTSGSPITRTVRMTNWLGCDTACYMKYQSSTGSTIGNYFAASASPYTTNSYWTITSDASVALATETGADGITSFAYGGPGGAVTPSTTITNALDANLFTIVDVTVPANSTRYLAYFAGVAGITTTGRAGPGRNTLGDAYSAVSTTFDSWGHIPKDVKADLTSTQLSQILNWDASLASSTLSIALPGGALQAVKGIAINVTATANQPGLITFYWNNKRVPRCLNVPVTTTATCTWEPNVTGSWNLKATLTPSDSSFSGSDSSNLNVTVVPRTTKR